MELRDRLRRWLKPPRRLTFTREGRYFVFITLAVGFAAINTGNNLLYLVLGMMLSLITLSGILSEMSLRGVVVQRMPPKHLYAGRPFLMSMAVRNIKRRLPSFSIEVEDLVVGQTLDKKCYFLKIPSGRVQETSYRFQFQRRGLYAFAGVRIATKFPFALFRKSRVVDLEANVLVYPKVVNVRPTDPPDGVLPGSRGAHTRGRGGEFHGLRELREGDDIHDVHWRTSARIGKLMVRQYEVETCRLVCLVLDNLRDRPQDADPAYEDELEEGVATAASLVCHYLDQDIDVELLTRSECIQPGRGLAQRWRLLKSLALLEFLPAQGAPPLPSPRTEGHSLLVTHRRGVFEKDDGFDHILTVGESFS